MAFDFPTAPPIGSSVTTPDGAVRYWDGQKWDAAYYGGSSPGARDASNDLSTAQNATIARTLANRFADRYSVEDWLTPGQPDNTGTFDCAPQIQSAINAAAANAQLLIPANPNPYMIGASLLIPSNSHIIIAAGATLKLAPNANQSLIKFVNCATGWLIEHYGTLDGNASMQSMPTGSSSSGIDCVVPSATMPYGQRGGCVSHSDIVGKQLGLVTNFANAPINLTCATNVEVSGVSMTNCAFKTGGSASITSVRNFPAIGSTPVTINGGSYTAATGVCVLTTSAAHGIVPGEEFATVNQGGTIDMAGTGGFGSAEGLALTAGPGTGGTTISYQVNPGGTNGTITGGSLTNWSTPVATIASGTYQGTAVGGSGDYTGEAGLVTLTTTAPHGLTFNQTITVNATAGTAAAIATGVFTLLAGTSGTTLRYTAAKGGANGTITAGMIALSTKSYNSGFADCYVDNLQDFGITIYGGGIGCYIRRCEVSRCAGSGPAIYSDQNCGRSIGCEISGCYAHDNFSAGIVVAANFMPSLRHANCRLFDNFVTRNSGGIGISNADGVDVVDNRLCANFVHPLTVFGYTGELTVGVQTSRIKVENNTIRDPCVIGTAAVQVVSGSYNSATGAVSLTTVVAHNLFHGAYFTLSGTGTAALLEGVWIAGPSPSTTVLNYNVAAGLAVPATFSAGTITPNGFGIALFNPTQCYVANNFVGDYQSTKTMLAAIGGNWGGSGLSEGNFYGPRINAAGNFPADMAIYDQASIQGRSFDLVTGNSSGTTSGLPLATATEYPPGGLSIGTNLSGTRAEIDFLLGASNAGQGGFDFIKVIVVNAAGTYNSTTAAVALTTNVAHGIAVGSTFFLSGTEGFDSAGPPVTAGRDLAKINGTWIATTGTTGMALNFTMTQNVGGVPTPWTGLNITSITAVQVNASTTDGGVIDISHGVAGSLLANDGLGNTRLGGALVHGSVQAFGTVASGNTLAVAVNTSFVRVQNSASIAALTLAMPAPAGTSYQASGAELEINFDNPIGTLTMTGAISGAATSIATAHTSLNFVYSGATWVRRIMA